MGGGKSGGSKQTSTQTSEPWKGVQPYLTDYLKLGQQVTRNPYQFYSGDTVAGFAPEQELGFNLGTQRALAGSPTLDAANRNITSTLQGNYLDPATNPYLRGTVNTALGDVQSRINSQFNNANFGTSAHQETLQRGLGEQANQIYGQNYAQERDRQLNAAGQATGLAGADYMDANYLQSIGAQRQGLANQYLGEAEEKFNQAAQWPYEQLQRYGNVVSQGTGQGGTSTTTGPSQNQSNPFADALGLGLSAASLFKLSDERLKSNIVKVGELPNGINVYEYDKFGKRERGVMAQEVEKLFPDAVTTHSSGYKMVNYSMLGA